MYPGRLITIEGIDGSGKSSVAQCLVKCLEERGRTVLLTKEPGGTELGSTLRTILHTQKDRVGDVAEFLLFAADRAQHFEQIILPALTQGTIVISDRMADSSLAYQGYGRGLNREMIKQVNAWAMQQIEPDIVLYLRVDSIQACKRVRARHEALTSFEQEGMEFWQRVSNGYEKIFAARKNVIVLDASLLLASVCKQACDTVLKCI
ncbi:MAG: dTMP kinase [Candidatus Babeliales bacterium]|jgi:dTMP kinase